MSSQRILECWNRCNSSFLLQCCTSCMNCRSAMCVIGLDNLCISWGIAGSTAASDFLGSLVRMLLKELRDSLYTGVTYLLYHMPHKAECTACHV